MGVVKLEKFWCVDLDWIQISPFGDELVEGLGHSIEYQRKTAGRRYSRSIHRQAEFQPDVCIGHQEAAFGTR